MGISRRAGYASINSIQLSAASLSALFVNPDFEININPFFLPYKIKFYVIV